TYRGTRALDSAGAHAELAFVRSPPPFRASPIHLRSMDTIAQVRSPDIACEIVIRIAAAASQIGVQIEAAVAGHPQIDTALVSVDANGRRDRGELGSYVAFIGVHHQPAAKVPQLE